MPNELIRNNNDDPLMIEVFKSELTEDEEYAVLVRKMKKLAGAAVSFSIRIPDTLPILYSKNIHPILSVIYFLSITVGKGTLMSWFFLNLEKESLSIQQREEKLAAEKKWIRTFKFVSSNLLSIIPSTPFFYMAYQASSFTTQEIAIATAIFRYIENVYGYYYFFNLKNRMLSLFSGEKEKSVKISDFFSQIIDNVIPIILQMKKQERTETLTEIYVLTENNKVPLLAVLQQLEKLNPEKHIIDNSFNKQSKTLISFFMVSLSLILAGINAIVYYEDGFKDKKNNHTTEIMHILAKFSIFPIFFYFLSIVNTFVNKFFSAFLKQEAQDFSSKFYPKTVYSILSLAYISVGFWLAASLTRQDEQSGYEYNQSFFKHDNYFFYSLFFIGNFLIAHVIFDFVYKSLITNFYEIYGTSEQKDLIRLINYLTHIKEDILQRANPEIMNQCFNKPENHQKLLDLGFEENPEPASVVSRSLGVSNSAGHRDGFFSLGRDGSFGGTLSASIEAEQCLLPEEQGLSEESEHNGDFVREYPREEKFYCAIM